MAVKITYRRLFECQIWHHYFLNLGQTAFEDLSASQQTDRLESYQASSFFQITPTRETSKILSGHRMRFLNQATGFFIGMEADPSDTDKPFIVPDASTVLRFYIRLNDSLFSNYSNLPMANAFLPGSAGQKIFRFSNLGHAANQFPNLTSRAATFDNTLATAASGDGDPNTFAYLSGDMLVNNAANPATLFVARRSTNNNTSNATDWRSINGSNLHFLNRQDQVSVGSALFNYSFPAPGQQVRLQATRQGSGETRSADFSTAELLTHQFDLRGMPPGMYTIEATNLAGPTVIETMEYYIDESVRLGDIWGVIEISMDDSLGNYSVLDGSGDFTSPKLELRILNRSTFWRYLDEEAFASVAVSGANNPLPLTRDGVVSVTLNGNPLPNPSVNKILPESTQVFSEILIDQDLYN